MLLLAWRNFLLKPWRSLFLLLGYSLGVAVMIVLLSIGEALLAQASNERLVGGGQITVLPEGIDVEVMKTGGLGGMFFSIDHARFIYRQLLAAPRLAPWVKAAAPQVESKLLYLRTANGRELPVRASGGLPSRDRAVGAAPSLAAGTWADDSLDRRWRDPTSAELRDDIDHFHLPPDSVRGNPTWAEWHYFNVLSGSARRWAYVSFIVGGAIPDGRWGGQVLVTLHAQNGGSRRYVAEIPAGDVRLSTSRADLTLGRSTVRVLPGGRYAVRAHAAAEQGSGTVDVDLVVTPTPGAYFPGAALSSGETVSGYVVPALRADADGSICVTGQDAGPWPVGCQRFSGDQAYHDHNWGVWRGVTWQWGSARAGQYAMLYGRVQPQDSAVARQPLFVYLVDSLGFLALFRPQDIQYDNNRTVMVQGRKIAVPSRGVMFAAHGDDTLRVTLEIQDATVTDTRRPSAGRGDAPTAAAAVGGREIVHPYFVQMKGIARLEGRVHGRPIRAAGTGFFETYR